MLLYCHSKIIRIFVSGIYCNTYNKGMYCIFEPVFDIISPTVAVIILAIALIIFDLGKLLKLGKDLA